MAATQTITQHSRLRIRASHVLVAALALVVLVAAVLGGWAVTGVRVDRAGLDLGSASRVALAVGMGHGNLRLQGSDANRFDSTFHYYVPEWKPEAAMSSSADLAEISLSQPSTSAQSSFFNGRYDWELQLKRGLPAEISVGLGAADAELDLRGIEATALNVTSGAGTTRLDLSGAREHSLKGAVTNGTGKITVILPERVGARVQVVTITGKVRAERLESQGTVYTNKAYGTTPASIELTITSPTADVELLQGR